MTQPASISPTLPASQAPGRSLRLLRRFFSGQDIGVFLILLLAGIYLTWKTDTFTSGNNIRNVTLSFSWIAIAAFGQTLVIIAGGIDLSTGSVMALSGLAAAYFISGDRSPWAYEVLNDAGRLEMVVDSRYVPLALIAGCAMGLILGAINGMLIGWSGLPPFIATLGMMSIARGFCYGWTEGWPFRQLHTQFREIGQGELPLLGYELPYPTLVMLVLAVVMTIFLMRTIWGYRIYALGGSEQAAELSGINTRHVKLLAYSLSGLLAGLGGTLMTARLGVAAPTAAQNYELDVIAAVFIGGASVKGGKGTMGGTLFGAALMQVIRNGLNLTGFEAYWQPAAIGSVIILAIMLDRAQKNPQVQQYFRQFEGRVAVASVLLMGVLAFLTGLALGLRADSMILLFISVPLFALLYFLCYRSGIFHRGLRDSRWSYLLGYGMMVGPGMGLLALIAGDTLSAALRYCLYGWVAGAMLIGVWAGIRAAVTRYIRPEARPHIEHAS